MKKYLFQQKDVLLVMQDKVYDPTRCYKGCLSYSQEKKQVRFEQAVTVPAEQRNPKLYQGEFVSLVHQKDGRYKLYCRTIDPRSSAHDIATIATRIALEIQQAAEVVK